VLYAKVEKARDRPRPQSLSARLRRARVRYTEVGRARCRRKPRRNRNGPFLSSIVKRGGPTGVQLVASDAHAGLKKASAQMLDCLWQRCSLHMLREALAHVRKDHQGMVAALQRL
jgi:hypothetical protein